MASALPNESGGYEYEVECVPLYTEHGKTRFLGTRRKDTGEIFATVTSAYEVLQNRDLVQAAEAAFKAKGLSGWRRKAVVARGGARCYVIYDFPCIGGKIAGQDVTFRLIIQNSFDGTVRASFTVGLFRLICSNGMAVPENTIGMTRRHVGSIEMDFVARTVEQALRLFFDALPMFQMMTGIKVAQLEGLRIINNLIHEGVFTMKDGDGVSAIWMAPSHQEDCARTLWNLYNAVTQHLTHAQGGNAVAARFEESEKCSRRISKAFMVAAQIGGIEALLGADRPNSTPADSEESKRMAGADRKPAATSNAENIPAP